ncbi:UNVERIFIED_ORG: chromosome segregation ATPase [Leuconostoc holzapfelii]
MTKNINTNQIDAPNSASAIASSNNATKAPQSEINQGKFTVNRDKVAYSITLTDASQRTLTIDEYQDKIANQNEVIGKNKQAIASYQKAIEQQTDAINDLEKQQVNTADSLLQTSIENARSSITQIRSQISEARNNIGNAKSKVESYEATIQQVKKGHSQLPKTKEI